MPTRYQGSPDQILALNTYIRLTRASEAVTSRAHNTDALEGLTISQLGVLDALRYQGPMCQSDIGKKILKSSGNMTLVIDNLEKRGLVRRERQSDDRRFIKIFLTGEGQGLIDRVLPGHVARITEAFQALSAEEQETLGELCRKLGLGSG